MFKIVVTSFLTILSCQLSSQNLNYNMINIELKANYPEIDFSNKLLVINHWNSTDPVLRESNKEFSRVCKIYEGAKLKGGLKGIVFVSISSDTEEIPYSICLKKDGINTRFLMCDFKAFSLNSKLSKLGFTNEVKNVIFDSNGILLNKNIETNQIFSTFNSLLTR